MKTLIRFTLIITVVLWIYNCNDISDVQEPSNITQLSTTDSNKKESEEDGSGGDGSCYVSITASGSTVYYPNTSGTISFNIVSASSICNNTYPSSVSLQVKLDGNVIGTYAGPSYSSTINNVQPGSHTVSVTAFRTYPSTCQFPTCITSLGSTNANVVYVGQAVSNVEGIIDGNGHPYITWTGVQGVLDYKIYLLPGTGEVNPPGGELVATVSANQTSYTDLSKIGIRDPSPNPFVPNGYVYSDFKRYWVKARYSGGVALDYCTCPPYVGDCFCQPTFWVKPDLAGGDSR